MNEKEEIRQLLKNKRGQISLERHKEASSKALDKLYDRTSGHSLVLSFASKEDEIDLWPLNKKLAREGRLLLPCMIHHEIAPYIIDNLDHLYLSGWGVLEPDPQLETKADLENISCILVPGLGFDKNHQRVGYGLGHFDRFLIKVPKAEFIGVGFQEQFVSGLLPIAEHDIPLHSIELF
jgi:5-formyltetrahydrofolate cyclo-ligase